MYQNLKGRGETIPSEIQYDDIPGKFKAINQKRIKTVK